MEESKHEIQDFYSNCPSRQYGSGTVWRLGYRVKDIIDLHGLDWLTGGIILPAVFRKVRNRLTERWRAEPDGKGFAGKGMTLLYVLIAARLDMVLGVEYIRNAVCIGFIANEVLSIVENAGMMGVPMPSMIKKAVDILKDTAESGAR